ncbi:hypothetical protein BV898_06613 [Hypsibius exemplaris]|uniref:V-SNARE coiled-coil homology domain-containing protein n=1 Tax=Hypsibius exemplaris TaxID=2072580 RepID=A0A1W0WVZ9_HYPEX|nr:hypothetical protein BV898_06613 [Hypsibius exemplaris]
MLGALPCAVHCAVHCLMSAVDVTYRETSSCALYTLTSTHNLFRFQLPPHRRRPSRLCARNPQRPYRMSEHAPAPGSSQTKPASSPTTHTPNLTNTHKGNQHYSLEGKLHDAEAQLNEVVHILHENEHLVQERAHKLEELRHHTDQIEHDAAVLDHKLEQLPKKD